MLGDFWKLISQKQENKQAELIVPPQSIRDQPLFQKQCIKHEAIFQPVGATKLGRYASTLNSFLVFL